MIKSKKGFTNLVTVLVLVLIAAGVVLYLVQRQNPSYTPPQVLQKPQTIQNDADLMKASNDLDNTNVDSLDTEMSQLDTDASGM